MLQGVAHRVKRAFALAYVGEATKARQQQDSAVGPVRIEHGQSEPLIKLRFLHKIGEILACEVVLDKHLLLSLRDRFVLDCQS